MAGPTRLELATSGVTGRRSNQLNYDPARVGCIYGFGVRFILPKRIFFSFLPKKIPALEKPDYLVKGNGG